MYCTKCGQKLEDGVPHVCPNAPVGAQPKPQYIPVQPAYALNTAPATGAVAALRKVSSSTAALVLTVALSVSLLAKFIGLVISTVKIFTTVNLVGSAASLFGASEAVREIRRLAFYRAGYGIIALVPLGLTVVGCYITYLSAKRPRNAYIKSTGFVFFKVVAVIDLIISILTAVGMVLLLIIGSILMSSGELEDYIIYWVTFCIVFVFANVLKMVAYIGLIRLSSECKRTAEYGRGEYAKIKGISSVYAIIKILSVIAPILSLIVYFVKASFTNALVNSISYELGYYLGMDYASFRNFSLLPSDFLSGVIAPLAVIVADIAIAVLVFSLHKNMALVGEGVYAPVAPEAYVPYGVQSAPAAPAYSAPVAPKPTVSEAVSEQAETETETEGDAVLPSADTEEMKDE